MQENNFVSYFTFSFCSISSHKKIQGIVGYCLVIAPHWVIFAPVYLTYIFSYTKTPGYLLEALNKKGCLIKSILQL